MSLFRYPGGKGKLAKQILAKISQEMKKVPYIEEYREPFFGGGSVGLEFLKKTQLKKAWINDRDLGIASIWTSVIRYPNLFMQEIQTFIPSVEEFFDFKYFLEKNVLHYRTVTEVGFKKLAIHQTSYSGLGTKAGGPIGGKDQVSTYDVACRWSPDLLCKKIKEYHKLFSRFDMRDGHCTALDFEELILDEDIPAIIYLDPPYFIKGNELYACGFTLQDHKRLADLLKYTRHKFVLSYDNCGPIYDLYSWAHIEIVDVTYSINGSNNKTELLITRE